MTTRRLHVGHVHHADRRRPGRNRVHPVGLANRTRAHRLLARSVRCANSSADSWPVRRPRRGPTGGRAFGAKLCRGLAPGEYWVGIACTLPDAAFVVQTAKFWATPITITAATGAGSNNCNFAASAPVVTTTTTTTTIAETTTTAPPPGPTTTAHLRRRRPFRRLAPRRHRPRPPPRSPRPAVPGSRFHHRRRVERWFEYGWQPREFDERNAAPDRVVPDGDLRLGCPVPRVRSHGHPARAQT